MILIPVSRTQMPDRLTAWLLMSRTAFLHSHWWREIAASWIQKVSKAGGCIFPTNTANF